MRGMAFCPSCGAAVDGRFCAKCGTPLPANAQSTTPPYSSQPASTGLTDNVASALCYALGFITGILFLVLAPYNQNRLIRFHAFQSIFLHVAAFVLMFALRIVVFGMFQFIGSFFGLFLMPLIWLGFLAVWIYMMVSAYQGKKIVLPVIGQLAEQQA
jgi:uncharacterized membrane protein